MKDDGNWGSPEVEEEWPKVFLEAGRVFKPADEDVPQEGHEVNEDYVHGDHRLPHDLSRFILALLLEHWLVVLRPPESH